MYKFWEKKSFDEIRNRVFSAIEGNVDYDQQHVLGLSLIHI